MIRNTINVISGPGSEPDAQESPAGEAVGVIGLGLLGSAIADQLLENGYIVYGFDKKVRNAKNVILLSDSTEVFIKCGTVVFSLPESRDVARVISEVDGVLEKGRHTVVDTTTGNPDEMERFHELLKKRGVDYIEASIAGSSEATRRAEAPLFLGGETESITRLQPLFKAISKISFNIGNTISKWGTILYLFSICHLSKAPYGTTSNESPELAVLQDFVKGWMSDFIGKGWDVLENGLSDGSKDAQVSISHQDRKYKLSSTH